MGELPPATPLPAVPPPHVRQGPPTGVGPDPAKPFFVSYPRDCYTTVSEEERELAQASSRLRAGSERWDDVLLFPDVPDVNDHAPVPFRDKRRIYHFFTQSL